MDNLPISRRASSAQIPISHIRSLAIATLRVLDDLPGFEDENDRSIIEHVTNFANLIFETAGQVGETVASIERDATKQERGR